MTRTVSWPHPEPFTPSTAERIGAALRDFLKTEHIAAAPVIFGLGRDRVFLKELRFPEIAPHEEAGLVRVQTGKELTESIENYAVDYTHLSKDTGGLQQVMTVAVRKDVVAMVQTLCQAAGLKLHAVTPKVFGTANALERTVLPEESPLMPKTLNAVLTVGQHGRSWSSSRGAASCRPNRSPTGRCWSARSSATSRFSRPSTRSISSCPDRTSSDVRRRAGRRAVRTERPSLADPHAQSVGHEADITAEVKNPACFAGAVGLAELWSMSGAKPINLFSPRRQAAPVNVTKQRQASSTAPRRRLPCSS